MAQYDFRKLIIKYALELANDKMTSQGKDFISYRINQNTMFITKPGADFANLKNDDIVIEIINKDAKDKEVALHSNIYATKIEINAIIHSNHDLIETAANMKKKMKAPLDDMAQIVGPTLRVVQKNEVQDIMKALKGRDACLVKGEGAISLGRTIAEAHTGAMVLFKACKCHAEGQKLGGTVTIPFLESFLMHKVYKMKYSNVNQELMIKKEKEEALIGPNDDTSGLNI